ncbi:response regulator transcription factor [Psychrobacillus sp. OK032]|uniref:response regulator transcription factor n=1 Tax=Psychrobacillus sp. OK032 TaxID=1884358 RepID=UPI0008B0C7F0|nr:response regulator transcription factor [Psychrobacillus sp. OK032]SES17600.1 DNA-binding response regulator, OmpR family, contains REC and winged-helix (wHTH) domain [Psychrobacillus sp. OK032]
MKKVLIIEDEESITEFLELELKHEGFDVTVFHDGRDGLEAALNNHYDLILLDLMLPHLNGIEICRRIRVVKETPIIMLTARDSVMDRVMGLDVGADDYMSKPFSIEELLARMRVIFRRNERHEENIVKHLVFNEIEVDTISRTVKKGEEEISLTKREYELLLMFLQNVNRVLSRELILEKIWGYETEVETNVVDVYVRYLRNKINKENDNYIHSVRGIGYVMK